MDPNWKQVGAKMEVEWVWNSLGIRRESMGHSCGISLEFVGRSDGLFGNLWGMHRGCLGMSGEFFGNY